MVRGQSHFINYLANHSIRSCYSRDDAISLYDYSGGTSKDDNNAFAATSASFVVKDKYEVYRNGETYRIANATKGVNDQSYVKNNSKSNTRTIVASDHLRSRDRVVYYNVLIIVQRANEVNRCHVNAS